MQIIEGPVESKQPFVERVNATIGFQKIESDQAALYELLTGHRPHHLLRAAVREMARVISEDEPLRPSIKVFTTEERLTPMTLSEVREGNPMRMVAAYLTRATFPRAIAALAGSAVYGEGWLLKVKIRLFHARVCGRSVFSHLLARHPALWLVLSILAAAVYQAIRERIWLNTYMQVMLAKPGMGPLLGDTVLVAAALALRCASMRLAVGPSKEDPLAR